MSWGENLRIETPEQIDFDLEVAGPGSRFYGQVLDWVIKWLILLGLGLVCLVLVALVGIGGNSRITEGGVYFLLALGGAAAFVFFLGYDIYYEGCCNGQTPGKRTAGLRVVRDTGGPIDVQAACIRNLVGLADFLPFFYLGGGLVALLNARGQRLGDMAAGTVVIRERAQGVRDDVEARILAAASDEFVFGPENLARCTANDQHILHSFFTRAGGMDSRLTRQLADKLLDVFLERTGYQLTRPFESSAAIVAFLASLYRDLKAHRQHS